MNKYLLILFFILFTNFVLAQELTDEHFIIPKNLEKALVNAKNNQDSVTVYIRISNFFRPTSIQKRLDYALIADSIYNNSNQRTKAMVYLTLAKGYLNFKDFKKVEYYINFAEQYFKTDFSVIGKRTFIEILYLYSVLYYLQGDIEKSIRQSELAKMKIEDFKDTSFISISVLFSLAETYYQQKQYQKAIENYLLAEKYASVAKDTTGQLAVIQLQIADAYSDMGLDERAINSYSHSLKLFEQKKDSGRIANVYNGLGIIYSNQKKNLQAIKFYGEYLRFSLETKDSIAIALAYNNIGYEYSLLNKFDSAEVFLKKSIRISTEINDTLYLANTYHSLGSLYSKTNKLDNAMFYFNLASSIISNNYDAEIDSYLKLEIARILKKHSKLNAAIKELDKAKKIAISGKFRNVFVLILKEYADIYSSLGSYQEAIKYNEKIEVEENIIYSESVDKELAELNMRYTLKKIESKIQDLEESTHLQEAKVHKELQTNLFFLGFSLVVLILIIVLVFLRRFNERYKKVLNTNNFKLKENKLALEKINTELTEINASKDRFFNLIALNLKRPFITLLNYSEQIINNYDKLNEEQLAKYNELINFTAQNLFELLENLLYWSRFEIGSLVLEPKQYKLNEFIDENIIWFRNKMNLKKILIKTNFSHDVFVLIDMQLMSLVFRNLISNAMEQTAENGIVKISTLNHFNWVEVSIEDNGTGLQTKDINEIMSIKQIGENPTNGLGLILSNKIIQMHQSKLTILSKEKIGSRISFRLNLA